MFSRNNVKTDKPVETTIGQAFKDGKFQDDPSHPNTKFMLVKFPVGSQIMHKIFGIQPESYTHKFDENDQFIVTAKVNVSDPKYDTDTNEYSINSFASVINTSISYVDPDTRITPVPIQNKGGKSRRVKKSQTKSRRMKKKLIKSGYKKKTTKSRK